MQPTSSDALRFTAPAPVTAQSATPFQYAPGNAPLTVAPSGVPNYTPVKQGGTTATSPVITSQGAQQDYNDKYAAYQKILSDIQSHTDNKNYQSQSAAELKARTDMEASKNNLAQQGIDIKKAEVDAKNAALGLVNNQSTSQTSDTSSTTSPNTQTTGSNTTTKPNNSSPSTTTNANTDDGTALSSEQSSLSANQAAKDVNTQNQLTLLSQLQNGTIPLTPAQNSVISSLQNQLATNTSYQNVANSAYTGSVTESMARSGGEYTPQQSQALITNAITSGVAKIQALDNSAASTIADLEQKFQAQNFDEINKGYDILQKQLDDKANTIKTMYEQTTAALKTARDYSLAVDTFNHTVYKDTAQLAQSNLEFRDAHDQFGNVVGTAVYDKSTGKLLGSSGGSDSNGNTTPILTVQINQDGTVNKESQDAFLQTIPAPFRDLVKQISNYQQTSTGLSPKTKTQIDAWAAQYNPNYNAQNYAAIQKTKNDYTSGATFHNIVSLNTSINHAGDLAKDFVNLPNGDITKFNSIQDWISQNKGSPVTTKTINDLNALGGELAKTYKGTAGTDAEVASIEKGININSSPAQFKAFIESSMNLLGGRLGALQEGYVDPNGAPIPGGHNLLNPSTQALLTKFANAGYDIKVPGIKYTNLVGYANASPENAKELASVRQQFPDMSPADALAQAQYNQSQGE